MLSGLSRAASRWSHELFWPAFKFPPFICRDCRSPDARWFAPVLAAANALRNAVQARLQTQIIVVVARAFLDTVPYISFITECRVRSIRLSARIHLCSAKT